MPRRAFRPLKRRALLKTSGAAGIAALAGCTGGGDGSDGSDGGDGGDPSEELPDVELYDADGNRIEPLLIYDAGSSNAEDIAAEMKRNLESIGVNLQTEARPEVLGQDFNSEPLPDANPEEFEWGPVGYNAGPPDKTRTVYPWDLLIGIRANSYPRTPGDTDTFWQKDSAVNAYGYVPEADLNSMYEEFRNSTDQEERQDLIDQIMGTLTEELPANFMSQSLDFYGFQNDINTTDDFNAYGAELSQIERYRNDQTVGGDYIQLEGTPLSTLLPTEISDDNSAMRVALMSDGAYAIRKDDEVIPLHIGIEDSGDSTVWVCTVRDNLQFGQSADGTDYGQMTAEDWVFQLENLHAVGYDSPENVELWDGSSPPSESISSYSAVENVEQTGELEFQLELPEADPLFPLRPVIWGEMVLPKALYEAYAPDAQALRESTEIQEFTWTGNLGPYQYEDRVAGAAGSFTTTRNDEYYMREHTEGSNVKDMDEAFVDAPYFERYQFNNVPEDSSRVEQLRNGEGDEMLLPTDNIAEFQQAVESVRVEKQRVPWISFLFFNQRSNGSILSRERDGREAMALVIDKQTISNDIQQGYTEPAVTFQPTWSNWYNEDAVNVYGVDIGTEEVEEARELLRQNDNFELDEV
ncbi:ABC transporter substrate-binding protein [Halovivax limisalsi]|uniref:ABC transporter substrate-binding protein n=1 Tax=Halovivax limisalsi TaxID=1453760 RepID=UPI001FFDBCE3|nr:ABC transporter substrate-binding protein [Halovivax limisalsi]